MKQRINSYMCENEVRIIHLSVTPIFRQSWVLWIWDTT